MNFYQLSYKFKSISLKSEFHSFVEYLPSWEHSICGRLIKSDEEDKDPVFGIKISVLSIKKLEWKINKYWGI